MEALETKTLVICGLVTAFSTLWFRNRLNRSLVRPEYIQLARCLPTPAPNPSYCWNERRAFVLLGGPKSSVERSRCDPAGVYPVPRRALSHTETAPVGLRRQWEAANCRGSFRPRGNPVLQLRCGGCRLIFRKFMVLCIELLPVDRLYKRTTLSARR